MQCKFGHSRGHGQQCEREATKGWTTCGKHHSAGISRAQYEKIQKQKRAQSRHKEATI